MVKESSGFPLDDFMDDIENPEPQDDWEKEDDERRKAGAKLLAKAIFAGDTSSVEAIAESIIKFQNAAKIMRSVF